MGAKYNPKRDRHIEARARPRKALGLTMLSPEILFRRASHDDLDRYTPEMLALTAAHALRDFEPERKRPADHYRRIRRRRRARRHRGFDPVRHRPQHAVPLRFGHGRGYQHPPRHSSCRASHPGASKLESRLSSSIPEEKSDPATRVSHIQIHLSRLTRRRSGGSQDARRQRPGASAPGGWRLDADAGTARPGDERT